MSKAFTKESDSDDDEIEPTRMDTLPLGACNYMTPQGAETLRLELQNLLKVERPQVVEKVAWAASNGDRSENGDYIYGKKRLREIDRRVRFLTKRLDNVQVVNPETQSGDKVLFGATVTVLENGETEKVYSIVGVDETQVREGKVSWISPIGSLLLQKKVGDELILKTPKGEVELEVLKIEYKALG